MANRHSGATLQKSYFVSDDEIARLTSSSLTAAPNSLLLFYAESVVSELIETSLPGKVLEQQIRFANPVFAGESVLVRAAVILSNPEATVLRIAIRIDKGEGDLPVCAGSLLISLK